MSFGREVPLWGITVHSAADDAGRRLRAAGERAADRAWYAKYDFVRGCRSSWLVARARAPLRAEAVLWRMGVVRQRVGPGPARMALGASLTLLAGALLAAFFIALSRDDGSSAAAPRAGVKAEAAVPGNAQKSVAGDARAAAHPEDTLPAAAARLPVSPRRPVEAPAPSPPAQEKPKQPGGSPANGQKEHPHGGPAGQLKKEHSAPSQQDHPDRPANGRHGDGP